MKHESESKQGWIGKRSCHWSLTFLFSYSLNLFCNRKRSEPGTNRIMPYLSWYLSQSVISVSIQQTEPSRRPQSCPNCRFPVCHSRVPALAADIGTAGSIQSQPLKITTNNIHLIYRPIIWSETLHVLVYIFHYTVLVITATRLFVVFKRLLRKLRSQPTLKNRKMPWRKRSNH